jgi:hypothetical protein
VLVTNARHDFGSVTQGDTLRHAFVTHNGTGDVLDVGDALEVLGCSGSPVPRKLSPGQHGTFEVTCRASIHGPLRVSLPLRANGRAAGELALTAEVEPLLAFDRPMLYLTVPFGSNGTGEARLRGKLAPRASLVLNASLPPGIEASVLPAVEGKHAGVLVRARRAPVGTHTGSLGLHTGLAEPSSIDLAYWVTVTGTLTVSPTNPVLDTPASEDGRVTVTVESSQRGFRVQRADVLDGPFRARVRRDGTRFAVDVTVVEGRFPDRARGANGRLLIVSNDRTEPRKEVPLFALAKRSQASKSEP